jgi:hypothetical protein
MSVLVVGLIVTAIILLLTYFLRSSDNGGDPSIPYATYGSYPIIGHLIPFIRDRSKLLMECRQRYGECFRIRVFNQYFTMVLCHADWVGVVRNQSFEFTPIESGIKIFDISSDLLRKYQPIE